MAAMIILLEFIQTLGLVLYQIVCSWLKFFYAPRKKLKGEIVFLTGAAGGIGTLLAKKLANRGCTLVLIDINEKDVVSLAQEINQDSSLPTAKAFKCDITNEDEVKTVCSQVIKTIGHPTILINNAAIVTGKYLLDLSEKDFSRTFEVNVLSHHRLVKLFLPMMLERNHGHVVCISSILALDSLAGVADYGSSKAAATGYMQSLRQEIRHLGKNGVHCTTIFPYQIHTEMFKGCASRFPNMPGLSILSADYVTTKMVDAIEKNQIILYIPRVLYSLIALSAFLPNRANDAVHDFLRTNSAMKRWTGRSDHKKD